MATQTEKVYLSCAETAKFVRRALAESFPGFKFSVRSHTYSGGASIDVDWTDGPRTKEVEPVAKRYEGGGFDGMIDMAYNRSHYLRPDGSVYVHYDEGTTGSMGVMPGEDNRALAPVMPEGVRVVRFGADYIFCQRHITNFNEQCASATAWIYAHCQVVGTTGDPNFDMFGNLRISDLARNLVHDSIPGEDWQDAFNRRYNLTV